MANCTLSPEVVDVLSRAIAQGNVLVLPPGQLNRKLYEAVNRALTNAGGKWKKGVGHLFSSDAAPKLAAMLDSGIAVDEKKRDQAFFTPSDLARRVVEIADVRGKVVIEPSAGMAALAHECKRQGAKEVFCYEVNPEYAAFLSQSYRVLGTDFLKAEPLYPAARIVMNPPFSKNQDLAHVNHALKFLAPSGILTAIMLDSQQRKGFERIVAEYDPEIIEIERGAFKESGTSVPTVIVKIQS